MKLKVKHLAQHAFPHVTQKFESLAHELFKRRTSPLLSSCSRCPCVLQLLRHPPGKFFKSFSSASETSLNLSIFTIMSSSPRTCRYVWVRINDTDIRGEFSAAYAATLCETISRCFGGYSEVDHPLSSPSDVIDQEPQPPVSGKPLLSIAHSLQHSTRERMPVLMAPQGTSAVV